MLESTIHEKRVAALREVVCKMKKLFRLGKDMEFHFKSGNFRKNREKTGN